MTSRRRANSRRGAALPDMDSRLERVLKSADRVLMHLEHQVPPERVITEELRALVDELMQEGGLEPAKQPSASRGARP
jgi:hypothetical protein